MKTKLPGKYEYLKILNIIGLKNLEFIKVKRGIGKAFLIKMISFWVIQLFLSDIITLYIKNFVGFYYGKIMAFFKG